VTQTLRADAKTERIIADFPILARPTSRGKRLVYLDSAATSQKPRAVIQALGTITSNIMRTSTGESTRSPNAPPTSTSTLALSSRVLSAPKHPRSSGSATHRSDKLSRLLVGDHNITAGDAILLTELEHHSDLVPWQLLAQRTGAQLRFIPVDARGIHVLDDLDRLLDGCKLVAISHVSNTLGTIAPLETLIPAAHAGRCVVLVDGAQGAPHLPLDVKALDADFYAFSGHKMLGPTGIGCLYGKRALLEAMPPFLSGGDMIRKVEYTRTTFNDPPRRFEAGTSNIADAIAFGVAADYLTALGCRGFASTSVR